MAPRWVMSSETKRIDGNDADDWELVAKNDIFLPGSLMYFASAFSAVFMLWETRREGMAALLAVPLLVIPGLVFGVLLERERVQCIWMDDNEQLYLQTAWDIRRGRRFSAMLSKQDLRIGTISIQLVHAKRTVSIPMTPAGRQRFS